MKNFTKIVFCLLLTGIFYSCKRSSTPSKGTMIGDYDEDLSSVRLKYEKKPDFDGPDSKIARNNSATSVTEEVPLNVNPQVDKALDAMSELNRNIRYSAGYRIQVYVGNERREVDEAKSFIYSNFPDLNTYLSFSQPTYRLKAGDFLSRMEAEKYINTIRQRYSTAMVVQERIDVRKGMQQNR